ncbi:MAG: ATP-dependent zinc protease [Oleiphilaceae bacterium]|nr:ATP-dependent zinc protease [Oleiphilaceae bacterium]
MTNASNTACNTPVQRCVFTALILATLILPGCALLEGRIVTQQDLMVVNAQLLEQKREHNRQRTLLENLLEAQEQHNLSAGDVHSAQSEQMNTLAELIRSRPEPKSCPEPSVVPSCPNGDSRSDSGPDKGMVGELEYVLLQPPEGFYEARIDTGATTSSMDARNIETFERDGEDWVRFEVPPPLGGEEKIQLEEPVVRFVRIIQSSAEENDRRPVVELQFQLGNTRRMAEFTLTDRSSMSQPLLIGRNILRDLLVVDVSQKHMTDLSQQALSEQDEETE